MPCDIYSVRLCVPSPFRSIYLVYKEPDAASDVGSIMLHACIGIIPKPCASYQHMLKLGILHAEQFMPTHGFLVSHQPPDK